MLEDVLIIEDRHRKAADIIVGMIEIKKRDRFIVAVSGESGSGKSELSHLIAKGLFQKGITAKVIHTDNFYKTLPLERKAWRIDHGVEKAVGLNEYDWEKLNHVVSDFRSGVESTMPCVDLITQRVDKLTTDFSEIELLILDGLYAINTPDIDLAIMIELTYHETKLAQVVRGKEEADELRFRVLEAEHKAVESLRPKAHLFINKDYQVSGVNA